MVKPPEAEEFIETVLSNETARPSGPLQAREDNRTISSFPNLLGEECTIVILHQFATSDGPLRFSDLEEAVEIAPNTLSNRLEELTEVGLLTRTAYNEIPPGVEYDATEKVRELAAVFWYLGTWTDGIPSNRYLRTIDRNGINWH